MSPVGWPDDSGEEEEKAVHRTACSAISMAPCPPPPGDHWRAGGLARAWPTGIREEVAITLLVSGIALDEGRTVPPGAVARAATPGLQAARALARMACRMQRPPWRTGSRLAVCCASFR